MGVGLISRLFGTIGERACSWIGDPVICGTGEGCRVILDGCGAIACCIDGSGDDAVTGDCDGMTGAAAVTLGARASFLNNSSLRFGRNPDIRCHVTSHRAE